MTINGHRILSDIIDGAYYNELDNFDLVVISRTAKPFSLRGFSPKVNYIFGGGILFNSNSCPYTGT